MIMVGYHATGAYSLFDPKLQKIVISNDVVFDEEKSWKWNNIEDSNNSGTIVTVNLEGDQIDREFE